MERRFFPDRMARPPGSFDPKKPTSFSLGAPSLRGLRRLAWRAGFGSNLSRFLGHLGRDALGAPLAAGDPVQRIDAPTIVGVVVDWPEGDICTVQWPDGPAEISKAAIEFSDEQIAPRYRRTDVNSDL